MCHVHDEMKTVLVWVLGVGLRGRRVSFPFGQPPRLSPVKCAVC